MIARFLRWVASSVLLAAAGPSSVAHVQEAAPAGKTAQIYTEWPFDSKEAVRRQEETAKALSVPREKMVDLGGGVPLAFVLVPAGKYMMGDSPGREASVDKPFYLGVFKVTQAQYGQVMGKNPSVHPGLANPVDSVNWADASAFCAKVSEKTQKTVRLPERKEWEWACRAGTATRCYWGDDMSHMGDYCWWHDNCGERKTHPVGKKKPNAFGLYDMMGLLWEWCFDTGAGEGSHLACGATFGSLEFMFKSSVFMELEDTRLDKRLVDRFGVRVAMEARE